MKKICTLLCALTFFAFSSKAQSYSNASDREAYQEYRSFLQSAYQAEEQIGDALEMIESLINDIVAAKKKGIAHQDQDELNDMIDMYECLYPFQRGLSYLIDDLELAPSLYSPQHLQYVQQEFEVKIEKLAAIKECRVLQSL